eukprot:CAMPEP_0185789302 /NCGR_PEP_ID=MMETSP1174-20130828/150303_1 /TAXON_ID=35687 /ORGANISM="Dictyocha speculum, Strain CCMP1381" /LENGTH=89 /DNA_ID=CAMNT_0028483365 /DNA_START=12 /DNA_END=278 /DNA_ORIENTATION=+
MALYDADGDGTLDKQELVRLAKDLEEQTELNNALLKEMTELEENGLRMQKEVKAKQDTLTRAVQVAESVRQEANELKRKVAVSQEIADK